MPYRIDVDDPPPDALDRLVDLGALDVEATRRGLAAIMPDTVDAAHITQRLGMAPRVSAARARDDGSVWVVSPRPIRVGQLRILPAEWPAEPGALRLIDSAAFGTGLHATTALCLEALDEELGASPPELLDVGTGTGILALAALSAGVSRAAALDIDAVAVSTAAENARLNGLRSRLRLVRGGPEALTGTWPLVLANVLAAPLIEMAPTLVRRVDRGGRLVLSGIRSSLAGEVERAYRRTGMQRVRTQTRHGWSAITLRPSW